MDQTPDSPLARLTALTEAIVAPQAAGAAPPPLVPLPQMALVRGRVHEFTGPSRRVLAGLAAGVAQAEGPVVWLRPAWRVEGLYPPGLAALMPDPGALVVVQCRRPDDILWGLEEALRAGCVALAVGELASVPDLRQLRRLHLAAAEGLSRNRLAGRAAPAPLGLVLDAETAASRVPGVESRWALHPLPPGRGAGRWRLDRLLMRGQPPRDWEIARLPVMDLPLLDPPSDARAPLAQPA